MPSKVYGICITSLRKRSDDNDAPEEKKKSVDEYQAFFVDIVIVA